MNILVSLLINKTEFYQCHGIKCYKRKEPTGRTGVLHRLYDAAWACGTGYIKGILSMVHPSLLVVSRTICLTGIWLYLSLNSASSLCFTMSEYIWWSLPTLLNEFLLQTAEFLINKLNPQIGYEEKYSGAFFKCYSMRGFMESKQSFQNFLAILSYHGVIKWRFNRFNTTDLPIN